MGYYFVLSKNLSLGVFCVRFIFVYTHTATKDLFLYFSFVKEKEKEVRGSFAEYRRPTTKNWLIPVFSKTDASFRLIRTLCTEVICRLIAVGAILKKSKSKSGQSERKMGNPVDRGTTMSHYFHNANGLKSIPLFGIRS